MSTRPMAVAGLFYPGDPQRLMPMLEDYLGAPEPESPPVPAGPTVRPRLRALVAPHAGYVYSGPVAGTGYRAAAASRADFERVILLGPSHRVPFAGVAYASATRFATPLGDVAVDEEALRAVRALPFALELDAAHAEEHSLEVHLPFLRTVLPEVPVVPLVVGDTPPEAVARLLQSVVDDATLIVLSSDLSHFLDYETAKEVDRATTRAIEALRPEITPQQACGCRPLNGLLAHAAAEGWQSRCVDLRSSGDTAGDRRRVVGYGAYVLTCS